jgi:hypothetical protein
MDTARFMVYTPHFWRYQLANLEYKVEKQESRDWRVENKLTYSLFSTLYSLLPYSTSNLAKGKTLFAGERGAQSGSENHL